MLLKSNAAAACAQWLGSDEDKLWLLAKGTQREVEAGFVFLEQRSLTKGETPLKYGRVLLL